MALSDRKPPVTYDSKIDQLLAELPDADAAWLRDRLTERDVRGRYIASAPWLVGQLIDESPQYEVSKSTVTDWRRKYERS